MISGNILERGQNTSGSLKSRDFEVREEHLRQLAQATVNAAVAILVSEFSELDQEIAYGIIDEIQISQTAFDRFSDLLDRFEESTVKSGMTDAQALLVTIDVTLRSLIDEKKASVLQLSEV